MDIDFYNKYIKYKTKYNELKNQFGGAITQLDIFQKKQTQYTASYVYTRDSNGVFYFGLARKVPLGTRKRLFGKNTGAAGTNIEYCGKWGSFGGSNKKNVTPLQAAIDEINEEANLNNLFHSRNVNVT